jgi:hypothetical protein
MVYRCGDCYQMDLIPQNIEEYVSKDNPSEPTIFL